MPDVRNDTIFALSSGQLPAAVAVVRISGPRARVGLERLIGRVPEPRRAALARVRDPDTGELIDEALALWFPGPRSETGEDTAELQLHGSRAVVAAVLAALGRLDGFRLAEPGEFTRRAFEHGRIDLTQVEALADLVFAETQTQRRQALQQFKGLLGDRAEVWRKQVIDALALVEAGIDFSDEADVPKDLIGRALEIIRPLAADICEAVASAARGERVRDGLWVVIAGPPNAGKSTLLNRIARRDAAIVSPHAGTTRDAIEVRLDLGGYPVNLVDTAGVHDWANDPVEQEGIRRARAKAGRADLVLWLSDASAPKSLNGLVPQEEKAYWKVLTKIDLLPRGGAMSSVVEAHGPPTYAISSTKGDGIQELIMAMTQFVQSVFPAEPALVTRERQRTTLSEVVTALGDADALAGRGAGEEFIAEQLRRAAVSLGRLTGRVDVEDVLDVIFRDFCIGK